MSEKYNHNSREVKEILKVTDCKLMHLRRNGILRAIKKGNAYMYNKDDVKELIKKETKAN